VQTHTRYGHPPYFRRQKIKRDCHALRLAMTIKKYAERCQNAPRFLF
jgi:hypothetical protein